jgi:hypothetical protein
MGEGSGRTPKRGSAAHILRAKEGRMMTENERERKSGREEESERKRWREDGQ